MDPTALVAAALAEPTTGFAAIYDTYGARIHDYCHSILRQRDDAADASHDTFTIAFERLSQLRDPSRLTPWLYSIARSRCMNRISARNRQHPVEDMEELTNPVDDATGPAIDTTELRQLVWDAAAGLAPEDRAVLDAHLRHGLTGADLAAALGVETKKANQMLHRMKQRMERTVGALVVIRHGRSACADLASLTNDTTELTPLLRKRIARHIDRCAVCDDHRSRYSPAALYATVPILAPPAALRGRILEQASTAPSPARLDPGTSQRSATDLAWDAAGFPAAPVSTTEPPTASRWLRAGGATVTLVVALVIGRSIGKALDTPPPDPAADRPTTTTAAPTTNPSTATSASPSGSTNPPTSPTSTTAPQTTDPPTSTTSPRTTEPTNDATLPTAPGPSNDQALEDITPPRLGALELTCTDTQVTARVTIEDNIDTNPMADLRLTNDAGLSTIPMTRFGRTNTFTANIDPTDATKPQINFTASGTLTDDAGNTAHRSSSDSCITIVPD